MTEQNGKIDLRTAQSTVHDFLVQAIDEARHNGEVVRLTANPSARAELAAQTEALLLQLLALPGGTGDGYHLAIADSGKRAIEVLVNSCCTGNPEQTLAVTTENYVGHNKWSAAQAMTKLKGVPFHTPFELAIGKALTIGSPSVLKQAKAAIEANVETLYLAWNSTSTGIEERVEELVAHRNHCGSTTLIMADASSLDVVSRRWTAAAAEHVPDAFFFSFRKHPAIPYDGPQDEIEQMKHSGAAVLFNGRARQRAAQVKAEPVYGLSITDPAVQVAEGELYTVHLLRLHSLLEQMLADNGAALDRISQARDRIRQRCLAELAPEGSLGQLGFSLVADPRAQSPTSFVVRVPEAIPGANLVKRLEQEAGISISPALHPLANTKNHNVVRFGVYSASTEDEVETMLHELHSLAGTML